MTKKFSEVYGQIVEADKASKMSLEDILAKIKTLSKKDIQSLKKNLEVMTEPKGRTDTVLGGPNCVY